MSARAAFAKRFDLCIVAVVALIMFCDMNYYFKDGRYWQRFIMYDGKGYYSYLPATFIYHDLNFGFFDSIEQRYFTSFMAYDYRATFNNRFVDRYYAGSALMLTPFFLTGHAWTLSTHDKPPDGYSMRYKMLLCAGAIFYCCLGIWFVDRTLQRCFDASLASRAVAAFAIAFGTNLHYYTVLESSMSHVYAFATLAAFVYGACMFFKSHERKYFYAAAFALGIAALVRPINVIAVLSLPFLAGSWQSLRDAWSTIIKRPVSILIGMLLFAVGPFVQMLIYKIQCGSWYVYAYGDEGFNFSHPAMFDFLFTYKKGWFVYTPLALLMTLLGVVAFWKTNRFRVVSFAAFLGFVVFVLSSWHQWWYGGSYSQRPTIDYLPFLMLAFGMALQQIKKIRTVFAGMLLLTLVLIAFNQFQMWQYRHGLIHWDSMDKQRYWSVFLKPPDVNFFTGE